MSLTNEGFTRPRLPEIKADYDARFTAALGPINTAPDAVIGQIIGVLSAAIDDAYEALQDTYDSMYPASAEGTSLDGAVAFVGLERLPASATTVAAMCYGAEGTLIPAGALTHADDNRQYIATADTVISRSRAGHVKIAVLTVTNSATYQVIAGGVSVTYTADISATAAEIVAGLAAGFDTAVFTASVDGDLLDLRSADGASGFSLTFDSKLSLSLLGSPSDFVGIELGANVLPVGALTGIDTVLTGWDTINNLSAGATGRSVETDEELRARHADGKRSTGSATTAAIRSRMLAEVDGVLYTAVHENRTNGTDGNGLPPHSIEVVVDGGSNFAVGAKLFEVKPAGIETHGTTSVQVTDENGDAQTCKFSRPASVYAWVRVSVDSLNAEEVLPITAGAAIRDAVLSFSETIEIGGDVIPQRFYGAIYQSTTGIAAITVEVSLTANPGDTPAYSTNAATVTASQRAVFDTSRVLVIGL